MKLSQEVPMARYQCPDCGYIYDESTGCEREGYSAGTTWDQIPDDFPCPDCFVREKPDFELVEEK
jgi:rubredoxin